MTEEELLLEKIEKVIKEFNDIHIEAEHLNISISIEYTDAQLRLTKFSKEVNYIK